MTFEEGKNKRRRVMRCLLCFTFIIFTLYAHTQNVNLFKHIFFVVLKGEVFVIKQLCNHQGFEPQHVLKLSGLKPEFCVSCLSSAIRKPFVVKFKGQTIRLNFDLVKT